MQSDDKAEQIMVNARRYHAAAVAQSRVEGRAVAGDEMWTRIDAKTARWEGGGAGFVFSQEFRDWAGYCRKLASHTGVHLAF